MPYTKLSNVPKALTFDDVQIVPTYSDLASRSDCDTTTEFTQNYQLEIPLVASPMASVCEADMAKIMWELGGVGIIHRFNTIDEQVAMVEDVKEHIRVKSEGLFFPDSVNGVPFRYRSPVIAAAVGAKDQDIYRAEGLLSAGANVILIDVAHGEHVSVRDTLKEIERLRSRYEFDVIAGNIATGEAAERLELWGADALRVGIGGGSVCETRIRTGVGIPQLSSIWNVCNVANTPVISCGGARYPGDIAKALAAGASSVILGSMFSGTKESPGELYHFGEYGKRHVKKLFHGSASDVQKTLNDEEWRNIEGTATMVTYKGSVSGVVKEIMEGLRSAMSYVGAHNLDEFYANAQFVQISPSGFKEGTPHLL